MAPNTRVKDNTPQSLIASATSLDTLLERFLDAWKQPAAKIPKISENSPDPLDVIHDAAKLLKAHTTKLSLLVINKPFTPSAIREIIEEIAGTVAPAMMSATELCQPEVHSAALKQLMLDRTRTTFHELRSMMTEIIAQARNVDSTSQETKGQLASTGVVWKACDELISIKTNGIIGAVLSRAKQIQALVLDALEELRDWAEDVEDEGLGADEEIPSDDEDDFADQDWAEPTKLPADREDLKQTVDLGLKRLKYVDSLIKAIIKHRLATFQRTPENVAKLNDIMARLAELSDHADDFAGALYTLDNDAAQACSKKLVAIAEQLIGMSSRTWTGGDDTFTSWSKKWIEMTVKLTTV